MDVKKEIKNVEIKAHHVIHYIGLPLLLIGSDLFIGIYGHFVGSTEQMTVDSLIAYIVSTEQLTELAMVLVVAIVVTLVVEWIVKERIKSHKRKR